jgi:P4 family phage/plasmid primase-like protien
MCDNVDSLRKQAVSNAVDNVSTCPANPFGPAPGAATPAAPTAPAVSVGQRSGVGAVGPIAPAIADPPAAVATAAPATGPTTEGAAPVIPPPPPPDPDSWLPGLTLNEQHREHLKLSWLSDETIDASGIKSADGPQLAALGFNPKDGPAMVIPYPHPSLLRHGRIRPDSDRAFQDSAKYRTRAGDTNALYIPLNAWEVTDDTSAPLLVIEGEKKTLAAMQAGYVAVGVPGVYGWRSDGGCIKDLDEFKWRERPVAICFDSDVWTNGDVQEALRRLVRELEGRGADVRVVLLPEGKDGAKVGVDDFLLANGACAFRTLVDAAIPLADAALSFIKPGMNPNRSQMVLDFVNRCIGSYPAIRDAYTSKLAMAMEAAGYGKQSNRTLSSGITRAIKSMARIGSSGGKDDCPENTAAEFLASECTTESGTLTLHLLDGQLYTYEPNSVYREISEEELKLDIVRWLQANKTQVTRHLVADVAMNAKAMCELPVGTQIPSWISNDPSKNNNWLAFQGGLVQMQLAINGTPLFENHTPEFLTTAIMPFHFMQNAQCPRWLQFLAETFDGDPAQILRLQEWFGAHIDLALRLEKFAMFVGEGSNGKSVVLRVLAALLGAINIVSIPLDKLGERFQAGRLRGKVANIVSDLEDTDKAAEGLLKMLVSQEEITGEHKNQHPFTFVPKARHTFATNVFPRFRDRSNGLWRRLLLFVFNNVVPEGRQDIRLADKIVERELPGIFNWALEGAKRLQANGRFSESELCTREAARYRVECNPVAEFLDKCCFTGEGHRAQKHLAYELYGDWCKQNGYKALSNGRFGRELKRLLPQLGETRPRAEGKRVVWYTGLGLAEVPEIKHWSR